MNISEIKPLNFSIDRGSVNGTLYNLYSYDELGPRTARSDRDALYEDNGNGTKVVLPCKGEWKEQRVPGVYDAGAVDFVVFPPESQTEKWTPSKLVTVSNRDEARDVIAKEEKINKLSEPWILDPDCITQFPIKDEDQPEMICLKTAMNKKKIDFDKYSSRFGQNFPNDKRQMKNNSTTLNILKRFCTNLDMEALLILRDKNENVANPIGEEVIVSLTDYE